MSGYNPKTGWTHFTPKKWKRYWRDVEGQPDDFEDRLKADSIDYYFDSHGGLHARCTDGELWTVLSGQPDSGAWSSVDRYGEDTELLTVADIGVNLKPEKKSVSVNKMLGDLGYQERIDGAWHPTAKADGLCKVFEVDDRYGKRQYIRWDFSLITVLNDHMNKK